MPTWSGGSGFSTLGKAELDCLPGALTEAWRRGSSGPLYPLQIRKCNNGLSVPPLEVVCLVNQNWKACLGKFRSALWSSWGEGLVTPMGSPYYPGKVTCQHLLVWATQTRLQPSYRLSRALLARPSWFHWCCLSLFSLEQQTRTPARRENGPLLLLWGFLECGEDDPELGNRNLGPSPGPAMENKG